MDYVFLVFFFIQRRMGKNKALAHHTSTYFHTRRVSIMLMLGMTSHPPPVPMHCFICWLMKTTRTPRVWLIFPTHPTAQGILLCVCVFEGPCLYLARRVACVYSVACVQCCMCTARD